ncbi:uncharacterized protein LOC126944294 isoform X2 [Macaca thibetana thibetana]|uniref:uncharacterized protein LOC126944294 isoform X2 n=1 Tax=Macaca thibetana thibetana TaxID=257877 RepID=UPI0021BC4233|nr:uncharacterized protein LOC126944294 isoform X2 [Macaca thibetana thibetana]
MSPLPGHRRPRSPPHVPTSAWSPPTSRPAPRAHVCLVTTDLAAGPTCPRLPGHHRPRGRPHVPTSAWSPPTSRPAPRAHVCLVTTDLAAGPTCPRLPGHHRPRGRPHVLRHLPPHSALQLPGSPGWVPEVSPKKEIKTPLEERGPSHTVPRPVTAADSSARACTSPVSQCLPVHIGLGSRPEGLLGGAEGSQTSQNQPCPMGPGHLLVPLSEEGSSRCGDTCHPAHYCVSVSVRHRKRVDGRPWSGSAVTLPHPSIAQTFQVISTPAPQPVNPPSHHRLYPDPHLPHGPRLMSVARQLFPRPRSRAHRRGRCRNLRNVCCQCWAHPRCIYLAGSIQMHGGHMQNPEVSGQFSEEQAASSPQPLGSNSPAMSGLNLPRTFCPWNACLKGWPEASVPGRRPAPSQAHVPWAGDQPHLRLTCPGRRPAPSRAHVPPGQVDVAWGPCPLKHVAHQACLRHPRQRHSSPVFQDGWAPQSTALSHPNSCLTVWPCASPWPDPGNSQSKGPCPPAGGLDSREQHSETTV